MGDWGFTSVPAQYRSRRCLLAKKRGQRFETKSDERGLHNMCRMQLTGGLHVRAIPVFTYKKFIIKCSSIRFIRTLYIILALQ